MEEYSTVELFLTDLKHTCKEHGITLKFTKGMRVMVEPGIMCSGYFDVANKMLVVAKGNESWLANLVHESCHIDQWLEQTKIWKKEEKFGTVIFDRWLSGKNVKSIRKSINNLLALELDCEKRAIKKIVEYDLPINTVTYIQRANAYILYYRYVYETGHWSNESIGLYDGIPSRFMSDSYYKRLSDKIRKIFVKQGH